MKIIVQTDNFRSLEEAVNSNCEGIRFGSEFCEYNMPRFDMLEKAYEIVQDAGKEFIYVTPRLSNNGIEKLKKQLSLMNEKGKLDIVINDLGALNILPHYKNLRPHLGRQEIRLPARSPWTDRLMKEGIFFKPGERYILTHGGFLTRRWYKKVLSNSNLNYTPTINLLRTYGITKVDIDWIPYIFSSFDFLLQHGLDLSVHLHLVPIAFTRKCHMARFLGEKSLEKCSRPCLDRAFIIRNDMIGVRFFLNGNVVFSFSQPSHDDIRKLQKRDVTEFIMTMNPVTGIDTQQKIDETILFING